MTKSWKKLKKSWKKVEKKLKKSKEKLKKSKEKLKKNWKKNEKKLKTSKEKLNKIETKRWKNVEEILKTLPEAQRTQGIDSVSWVISKVEMKTSCRDYLRYGVNTLGPLCLWQCLQLLNAEAGIQAGFSPEGVHKRMAGSTAQYFRIPQFLSFERQELQHLYILPWTHGSIEQH